MKKRYIQENILDDLQRKMVFIGGPRYVGKSSFCSCILNRYRNNSLSLDFNDREDRGIILSEAWGKGLSLVVFHNLNKLRYYKRWIKGIYDVREAHQQYMVTGSARLDVYKRGGDSLLGRYHYWRLHPFTIDEHIEGLGIYDVYNRLLKLGGFPEPFFSNNESLARRWRIERFEKITNEDIRDISNVKELDTLRVFLDAITNRTGQLLNLTNIARDLEVSPNTAKEWLAILEACYIGFAVRPLIKNVERSLLKKAKFYFFDNADCSEEGGTRLENLVATTLLKRLHYIRDRFGFDTKLHYIRDKDGREVDFATVIDGKLYELIEVKSSDDKVSSSLKYYKEKLNPKHIVQLVGDAKRVQDKNGILILNPIDYFTKLDWNKAPWFLDDFKI